MSPIFFFKVDPRARFSDFPTKKLHRLIRSFPESVPPLDFDENPPKNMVNFYIFSLKGPPRAGAK